MVSVRTSRKPNGLRRHPADSARQPATMIGYRKRIRVRTRLVT